MFSGVNYPSKNFYAPLQKSATYLRSISIATKLRFYYFDAFFRLFIPYLSPVFIFNLSQIRLPLLSDCVSVARRSVGSSLFDSSQTRLSSLSESFTIAAQEALAAFKERLISNPLPRINNKKDLLFQLSKLPYTNYVISQLRLPNLIYISATTGSLCVNYRTNGYGCFAVHSQLSLRYAILVG